MSELTATQALEAEIEKANPLLAPTTPAKVETPDLFDKAEPEPESEESEDPDTSGDEETEHEGEEETEQQEPEKDETPEKPERPNRKKRAQARINELVAQRREAEALAEKAAEEREYWRQKALEDTKPQTQSGVEEKTLADFDFDQTAHTEYLVERRLNQEKEKQRQVADQQRVQTAEVEFGKRAASFREKTPDFDDVAFKTPLGSYYPKEMVEAIRDSEVGPQLAYYLGQNLDKTDALLKLPSVQLARELGKIEARLESPAIAASSPPPRSATRAPAVGSTVSGTSSASKSLESMSVKDHIEAMRVKRNH